MENKFWIFYIAISLVLFTGMVSGATPTVNSLQVPSSVSLSELETNNTFDVMCQYSDDDGTGDINEIASHLEAGTNSPESIWNYSASDAVTHVTVDSDYVYAGVAGKTVKLFPNGTEVWSVSNGGFGLDVDSDGNVYTGGSGISSSDSLWKYNSSGHQIWERSFDDAVRSVSVSDGYVYGGGFDDTVRKFDVNGTFIWNYTGHTSGVSGIAAENGYVYTASSDSIARKINTSTGNLVWQYSIGSERWLEVDVDSEGNVYLANSDDYTVRKLSPSGDLIWKYTGHTGTTHGVTVGEDGYVYSSSGDGTVRKLSPNGNEVWVYQVDSGTFIDDVAVDSYGNVYAGSRNNRLEKIGQTIGGSEWKKSFSEVSTTQINTTTSNVSSEVTEIPYYKNPQKYFVKCYITDDTGEDSILDSTTIPTLVASNVNINSVDFGSLSPGSSSSSSVFNVENTGNVKMNSGWDGTDFIDGGMDQIDIHNIDILYGSFYDVTKANYTQSRDFSSEDSQSKDVTWNNDGSKMYMAGRGSNNIYQYSCSNSFNITSCSYQSYKNVGSEDDTIKGVTWNNDGSKMYVIGWRNKNVYQYSCSNSFDVTSCSYQYYKSVGNEDDYPQSMAWNDNGSKMYMVGRSGVNIYEYNLSTAFDVTSASYQISKDVNIEDDPRGMAWNNDGSKMFMVGDDAKIYQYSCSGFSLTSCSLTTSRNITEFSYPTGILWNDDGSKMYVVNNGGVYEYTLGRSMGLTNTEQLFKSLNVLGNYNPYFELNIPYGTPAGTYTNTFTHSISQA